MRVYLRLLFFCIMVLSGGFAVAQVTLEFEKKGRLTTDTLNSVYKPNPNLEFRVIVNDPNAQQPASKFQKLIAIHSAGLVAPYSDSSRNAFHFPYKANGNSLTFWPAAGISPAIHHRTLFQAAGGEFSLTVTQPVIDNSILKIHFEDTTVRNSYHDFMPYLRIYDSLRVFYDHFTESIDKLALQYTLVHSNANGIALGIKLDSINEVQTQLVQLVQMVKTENTDWMKNWKWLAEGKEILNPFFPNVSFLRKRVDQRLASQEALLSLLQSSVNFNPFAISSTGSNNTFSVAQQIISGLTNDIQLLKKENTRLDALEKTNKAWLAASSNPEATLHEFKIYLTDPADDKPIVWMQHKDAFRKYASMNKNNVPNTVYETDQMMAYVHNLQPGQAVKAGEKVDSITLTTTTEDALKDPFEALSKAKSSSASILSLLAGLKGVGLSLVGKSVGPKSAQLLEVLVENNQSQQYEESLLDLNPGISPQLYKPNVHGYLFRDTTAFLRNQLALAQELKKQALEMFKTGSEPTSNILKRLRNVPANDLIRNIDALIIQLENNLLENLHVNSKLATYQQNKSIVQWLALQTPPPFEEIENAFANPEKKSNFRSENVLTGESRSARGTNVISYTLTQVEDEKTAVVAKDQYKTYKTVRFWPTVGINYVFNSRSAAIFSDSASAFKNKTDIDNFEAVVGVKIYLHEKNITTSPATRRMIKSLEKDNQLRGNNLLSSTFIHVGLGMSHNFLKNYFVGIGLDLFPGVSMQAGGNLYFRKGYELQNGQIKNSTDKAQLAGYIGIYLDPTLVTRLIQLF